MSCDGNLEEMMMRKFGRKVVIKTKEHLSELKVGDLFKYKDIIYEVCQDLLWEKKCRYVNDKASRTTPDYLYCNFSIYTNVSI